MELNVILWYGMFEVRGVNNQPTSLSEIISSGAKVIITIATAGSDKRVRIGQIVMYDAGNQLLSVRQEDNTVCLVPLGSISSIETLRTTKGLLRFVSD